MNEICIFCSQPLDDDPRNSTTETGYETEMYGTILRPDEYELQFTVNIKNMGDSDTPFHFICLMTTLCGQGKTS